MTDAPSPLLLTPGPLTTSPGVRQAMLRDRPTRDREYKDEVEFVRDALRRLATDSREYSTVLMQGSGTFAIEATLGSVVPSDGRLLIAINGAYGRRMAQIAERLKIDYRVLTRPETEPIPAEAVAAQLADDTGITHVATVHCETTTGVLNPVEAIGRVVAEHGARYILDAMSSFGGIPLQMEDLGVHFLVSSANKCIQGVPGFGFVLAHRASLLATRGWARSLSLDLLDQWEVMEAGAGDWRFTSPTHVVAACAQALRELADEGGVAGRFARYTANQALLVGEMREIGFRPLLDPAVASPIITSFLYPSDPAFDFVEFYDRLKARGFVIYQGKIAAADTFRIGTIGHIFPEDVAAFTRSVAAVVAEMEIDLESDPSASRSDTRAP